MSIEILDQTGLPESAGVHREVSAAVGDWLYRTGVYPAQNIGPFGPKGGSERSDIFARRRYEVSSDVYEQMRTARQAVSDDDVISGVAEVTEGLMFQGLKFESSDPDESDVFNQLARDLDLDSFVRQAYRELFTYSQVVVASLWTTKEYTPRGTTEGGRKRRRIFRVDVPERLFVLDSLKVIPMQPDVTGRDRLLWYATEEELAAFLSGRDKVLRELCTRQVTLTESQILTLPTGVNPDMLLELNPERVWRHTVTKPGYARWADIRIRGVFQLLDLKQNLFDADRAALSGNARYIVLVRKGTDQRPATPEELANTRENFSVVAKFPVITSDHRLSIEIVAPKMDLTLNTQKYDTIDRRLLARTLGALTTSSTGQRNESTLTVARMVGRLLESKRHMIKRALEANVFKRIVDGNDDFGSIPSLTYLPARIELDNDGHIVQAIIGARARNELSRESYLEFLGFDQGSELQRREMEKVSGADDVFQTRNPFDSPANNNPGGGGQPNGENFGGNGRPRDGVSQNQNATAPGKPKAD